MPQVQAMTVQARDVHAPAAGARAAGRARRARLDPATLRSVVGSHAGDHLAQVSTAQHGWVGYAELGVMRALRCSRQAGPTLGSA